MKKAASFVLAFSIALSAFAGSASAATKLETAIDPLIGTDYKYAGTTTNGFDCSGFTSYVFEQLGIDLPRSSGDQATVGVKISKDELQPGDLVFFNTNGKSISHVGIYMGDGMMAHSSSSRGVTISEMNDSYYSKRYVTARRILDQQTYTAIATDAPVVAEKMDAPVVAEKPAAEVASTAPIIVAPPVTEISDDAVVEIAVPEGL